MIKLLEKIIKNSDDISNPATRRSYGVAASIIGIALNVILFAGKLAAGTLAGAISITSDAFNNLSDAGAQIVSLVSFKMSAKPADRKHPFGHARIEYVASMIVSFLVLLVGYELFCGSVEKLINPAEISRERWILTVVVLAISILAKLWLGIFNRRLAKKLESSIMKATAADSFSDALSTSAVLAGMILYFIFGWNRIDAVMGLLVSVTIFIAGIKILNETKNSILGEAPSDEIVEEIHRIIGQYPEILGIHDMVIHNYGPGRIIASLHVEVDGKCDIFELHDAVDAVERRVSAELSIETTIHMDPIVTDDDVVCMLRDMAAAAVGRVDAGLSIHDFRCVIGHTHTNLIFDIAVPFEMKMTDSEICDDVRAKIREINPAYCAVINIDRE